MKKILAVLILSAITLTSYADFICKDIGPDGNFPHISTFYKCREEAYIDFSTWYN